MSTLISACPRCGAGSVTLDIFSLNHRGMRYDWQNIFECFCVCRHCQKSTIFVIVQNDLETYKHRDAASIAGAILNQRESVNRAWSVQGYVSLKDDHGVECPAHVPDNLKEIFDEGATCLAVKCFNAAGTMFRLCIDLATLPLLPSAEQQGISQPNSRQRRDLGLRLPWLFQQKMLPADLHELAECIKEDGNDAAHRGTLDAEAAADIKDFTELLLNRLFTEPRRIELANERRMARRAEQKK